MLPADLRRRLDRLEAELPVRCSVARDRDRATPAADLVERLADDPSTARALADGLESVVVAIARNFPDNLYADLDRLAGVMATCLREGGTRALASYVADVVAVHERFGRHGPIRFRYVHDFLYGFDWARWVRRDRRGRGGVDPYAESFVRRMLARGAELEAEIERDGPIYRRLSGSDYRNPFRFSREPEVEGAVLAQMAADGNLPVEAHIVGGAARADRDFEALRRAYVERIVDRH